MTDIEHIKGELPILARLKVMRGRGPHPCMSYSHITGVLAEEGVVNSATGQPWTRIEIKAFYERATAGKGRRRLP